MKKTVAYHGYGQVYINMDDDIILIHPDLQRHKSIMRDIDYLLEENRRVINFEQNVERHTQGDHDAIEYLIPNTSIKIYSYDKPFTSEEANDMLVQSIYGDFDARTQNYGYSEYTIMGFNLERMQIGGHDLKNIFEGLQGEYVHFILEVEVNVSKNTKVVSIDREKEFREEYEEILREREERKLSGPRKVHIDENAIPIIAYVTDKASPYVDAIKLKTQTTSNNPSIKGFLDVVNAKLELTPKYGKQFLDEISQI